ncbi:nucleotidyl transferase AbiEii/AbiGii toxin family protein [Alienimonas chondri]|uniref:Nucleotidyltransferase family protein n=1 Tax=Alienimonas chondri TaxID=2681879 RepID=A0ABX1VJG8_9PLAN|nr:nucleotidyl transferase AbiEii/AbiGii toxin family protein [Alienimonas chondri]NNJ27975.1 hypothetical protein [Alienimonas chondri]
MSRTAILAPPVADAGGGVIPYERRLDMNRRWALSEGGKHFEGRSEVETSLHRIADRLNALGVPYALVGGMALFQHGFRRFTEDVDLLVTQDGLNRIHENLRGRGYLPPFEKSKNLRDTQTGVRIEFLVTGRYPGKGEEIPISFPDPAEVGVDLDGLRCVRLETLVELKLASGKDHPPRFKDLVDVQSVIKALDLPRGFSEKLHPYVRSEFLKWWDAAQTETSEEEL